MTQQGKQLSNPFSTGGGGAHFEAQVQALFVVLMLTRGVAPCLPPYPIRTIKLQGKVAGYDTDDLIISTEQPGTREEWKLLGQIKHTITVTEGNAIFGEVLQAAWRDFNNPQLFTQERDVIALMTGPLSATDIQDVRPLLEWARHQHTDEFLRNVQQARFSSQSKRQKLHAFRTHLTRANGDQEVSNDAFVCFLRHFHLLGYDLNVKNGTDSALLHSLIAQYDPNAVSSLWARIVDEVQSANKNAGTITRERLPADLQDAFRRRIEHPIPAELVTTPPPTDIPHWHDHPSASALVIANLVGGWNEHYAADRTIIQDLAEEDYATWRRAMQELLNHPNSPLTMTNGVWRVADRVSLWQILGPRVFDDYLNRLQQATRTVLTEIDPQFDLPVDDRFAASLYGKGLTHSSDLRSGLAESLVLVGTRADALTHCTQNQPERMVAAIMHDLFDAADGVRWGSLQAVLPTLAEAAPDAFLAAVEQALEQTPCPFDDLFAQERPGLLGHQYLTGFFWALEVLAWDADYLVRVGVLLGALAAHDPGGQRANRPINSLTMILLPWFPQTLAPIETRFGLLQALQNDVPAVAWNLLLRLLPRQQQTATSTHKPVWRQTIPNNGDTMVNCDTYWEHITGYLDRALALANHDPEKLRELIRHLNHMPAAIFDTFLEQLAATAELPEVERLPLWETLTTLVVKHRRIPNAVWALPRDAIDQVARVVDQLDPTNPLYRYRRLFNSNNQDLYETRGNYEEQRQNLTERRQQAIRDILAQPHAVDDVIDFSDTVEDPYLVGYALGGNGLADIDDVLFPNRLAPAEHNRVPLVTGYVQGRYEAQGWDWVDGLDTSGWSIAQRAQFLTYLPFTDETWDHVTGWLGEEEAAYWNNTVVRPNQVDQAMGRAVDKLIVHGRPLAAITCLSQMLRQNQLDRARSVTALRAAPTSPEASAVIDTYDIVDIITALQNDPDTDPNELMQIEWLYLSLLDRAHGNAPQRLEQHLASDAAFFCEVIDWAYREDNEHNDTTEEAHPAQEQAMANNAWDLLQEWQIPPGTQPDGRFVPEQFTAWLEQVQAICTTSGHLQVAMIHVGTVLYYCPPDPEGFWIDHTVARVLNAQEDATEHLRQGLYNGLIKAHGVSIVDPTGQAERAQAEASRTRATASDQVGYQRLATTLRNVATWYERDADHTRTLLMQTKP